MRCAMYLRRLCACQSESKMQVIALGSKHAFGVTTSRNGAFTNADEIDGPEQLVHSDAVSTDNE